MSNKIYQNPSCNVYRVKRGFILHNRRKNEALLKLDIDEDEAWKESHSHLNSFNAAKYFADIIHNYKLPTKIDSTKLIERCMRVLEDGEYKTKYEQYLLVKQNMKPECRRR